MFASSILGVLALSLGSLDGPSIEDVTVQTLAGDEVQMSAHLGGGPLVIAYTGVGCPISGKYAPRLTRLAR